MAIKQHKYKYDATVQKSARMGAKLMKRFGQESSSFNLFANQMFHIKRNKPKLTKDRKSGRYAITQQQALSAEKLRYEVNKEFRRADNAKRYYARKEGATHEGMARLQKIHEQNIFKIGQKKILRQKSYAMQPMKEQVKGVKNIESFEQFFDAKKDILFKYFGAERLKELRNKYGYDETDIYAEFRKKDREQINPYTNSKPVTEAMQFGMTNEAFDAARRSFTTKQWDDFMYNQDKTTSWKSAFTPIQLKILEENTKKYGKF